MLPLMRLQEDHNIYMFDMRKMNRALNVYKGTLLSFV